MPENKLLVRKAAVLGAGVMGAQIAAHLVNSGVPAVLFELPAKEGPRNGLVDKAIAGLANNLNVGLGFEQPSHALPQELVVVRQEHPDHS